MTGPLPLSYKEMGAEFMSSYFEEVDERGFPFRPSVVAEIQRWHFRHFGGISANKVLGVLVEHLRICCSSEIFLRVGG